MLFKKWSFSCWFQLWKIFIKNQSPLAAIEYFRSHDWLPVKMLPTIPPLKSICCSSPTFLRKHFHEKSLLIICYSRWWVSGRRRRTVDRRIFWRIWFCSQTFQFVHQTRFEICLIWFSGWCSDWLLVLRFRCQHSLKKCFLCIHGFRINILIGLWNISDRI